MAFRLRFVRAKGKFCNLDKRRDEVRGAATFPFQQLKFLNMIKLLHISIVKLGVTKLSNQEITFLVLQKPCSLCN